MIEPKLRFKADDGSQFPDWKEKKIGDLFYKVNERNNGQFGKDKWISVAKMYYQDEDKVTSNNIDTRTYVMRIGDMAFEGHPNKEFKYGRFVVNDIGDGIISELFPIYRHKGEYVLKYWKYAIQIDTIMQKIYRKAITSSGASSNKLDNNDFENQSIPVPCLEEQQKIAEFLSTVDTVIEKQKETVSAWGERKKGVMQKLFSQEVRFKADDGSDFPDWEEKKIGDLILLYDEKVSSNCKLPILTSSKKNGIEYQEEHFSGKQRHDIDGYNILPRNYCTYRNRSDGTDFTFNINRICDEGIVSKFYPVFRENNSNLFFLVMLLNNEPQTLRKIAYTAKGTGQKVLSITDLKSITVMVPSVAEQQKIADCLSSLDDVIEKQKATLAAWEEMKKGLLQQMFV